MRAYPVHKACTTFMAEHKSERHSAQCLSSPLTAFPRVHRLRGRGNQAVGEQLDDKQRLPSAQAESALVPAPL